MNTPQLPPLPEPTWSTGLGVAYTAEQMQAYALAAIAAQGVPDGWRLVPVKPTKHMLDASALDDQMNTGSIRAAWKDMVNAAPPAPQVEKPENFWNDAYDDAKATGYGPKLMPQANGFDPGWPFPVPQADVVQQEPLDKETQTMKLMGLIDDLIEADPDRAERFIESVLAKNALRKRLADKKAAVVQHLASSDPVAHQQAITDHAADLETRAEIVEQQVVCLAEERDHFKALYMASKQAKPQPLSDEQFQRIKRSLFRQQGWDGDGWDQALKEAIEAAHGIKE